MSILSVVISKKKLKREPMESQDKRLMQKLKLELLALLSERYVLSNDILEWCKNLEQIEKENFQVLFEEDSHSEFFQVFISDRKVYDVVFWKENKKVKRCLVTRFAGLTFPVRENFLKNSQKNVEIMMCKLLNPDITIVKKYWQVDDLLPSLDPLENLSKLLLVNIKRYKEKDLITEEFYDKGVLVNRYYNFYGKHVEEFVSKNERIPLLSRNRFDKVYQNALALTKERK